MREILLAGAKRLGIAVSDTALAQFEQYAHILEEENSKMNLTAAKGENEIAERHFLDSMGVLAAAGHSIKDAKVIDIGCGAGFPGVPMKIAEPSINLTALDSTEKKVMFLQRLFTALELKGALGVYARAEELVNTGDNRENFDFAVSRAVARLSMLSELCLPYVKVGGSFLAMKTASSEEEVQESVRAIHELGGKLEGFFDYEVMGVTHRIVKIKKISHTPEKYPRRFAKISKQPL